MSGCAIWFVGLPGSGKSSVVRCVFERWQKRGFDVVHHEMDRRRKTYFPTPEYTEQERVQAYAMFIEEAFVLAGQGKIVFMDASAHRAVMRDTAREKIERFAEILIRCDLDEAMRRERERPEGRVMADMYDKALERRKTGQQFEGLGDVIGVDVPFEEGNADLVVDNTRQTREETCEIVIGFLDSWLDNA